jgi:hypothetical protein
VFLIRDFEYRNVIVNGEHFANALSMTVACPEGADKPFCCIMKATDCMAADRPG